MKRTIIFLLFALMFNFGDCGIRFPVEGDEDGEVRILVLIDNDDRLHFLDREAPAIPRVLVEDGEIGFYYMSRNTNSKEFFVYSVDDIVEVDFDPSRRTMFIVHGWNNNKDSLMNQVIPKELLRQEDWNIFVVDWREKANSIYSTALGAVPGVAEIISRFITLLQKRTGLRTDKIHLTGHSLGAHICGQVGNLYNGQIEVIMGLDPALPFVDQHDVDKRLDPSDAKYVQIIHTNAGLLGFLKPVGHADFYPNGGMNQKGCGLDIFGKCAHSRSYLYYAESIKNDNFKARFCESNADWKAGKCNNNQAVYMGGNNLERVYGTFYLNTGKNEPYALG